MHKGRLGYRVLQIVHTEQGALLVNLGWVLASKHREVFPEFSPLAGAINFTGHIRIVEQGIVLSEQDYRQINWPLRIQQIELDKFSQIIAQKLLPFVVYLDKKETIGFEKNWQPIVMPPEKHRAYAVQWFALASAWLLLMVFASIKFYQPCD